MAAVSMRARILGMMGVAVVLVVLLASGGCKKSGAENNASARSPEPSSPAQSGPVRIVIGNLTDKTGVSANALNVIDMALEDLVGYYNEEGLIPGVKLEVATFDGQWDPARNVPGYEKLRNKGADMIWTPVPPAVETLMPRVSDDEFVLFASTANMDPEILEGGYVFSLGIMPEYEAYTFLKWIAENDPDFPQGRPAKIGGASWLDGYSNIWFRAAEAYAKAHPDQYEWVGGYMTQFSFTWGAEVEKLKSCDYVYVPAPMYNFVKEYREAGYTTAKFLGTDVQAAFLAMLDDAGLWDGIDGMLFSRSSRWYNEHDPIIDLANKLLDEKHPAEAADIREGGSGYIAGKQAYLMLEIIKKAVNDRGAQNFDSQTLFDAATSFSFTLDGIEGFASFDKTKRYVQNYYSIYEARASGENIFRIEPEWIEQVMTP